MKSYNVSTTNPVLQYTLYPYGNVYALYDSCIHIYLWYLHSLFMSSIGL